MKVVYYVEEFNEMIGINGDWEGIYKTYTYEAATQYIERIKMGLVADKYPEGMYRVVADVY